MNKVKSYILLNLLFLLYSCVSVFSKIAADKVFFSLEWCLFYGIALFLMGVYALLWQQMLKKIPLNIAYANKSVTLIWAMIWGVVIFKEAISFMNIIGAVVVLTGVIFMVTAEEKK